jgi:hypothetical protein
MFFLGRQHCAVAVVLYPRASERAEAGPRLPFISFSLTAAGRVARHAGLPTSEVHFLLTRPGVVGFPHSPTRLSASEWPGGTNCNVPTEIECRL